MIFIDPRFRITFLALFAVFILFGTSVTIIGATLPKILADFHWSYFIAGAVIGAGAVAYFLSTFAAGYLIKHCGPKPTILLALVLDIVGLSFFATNPDPLTNILLSALIGLGQGPIEVTISYATMRIDERNTGRPMNVIHGAFAVGAILGPLAVGALLQSGLNWPVVYRGIAFIFALLVVLMCFIPLPHSTNNALAHGELPERLNANSAYWLSFFALFFYVGVEMGLSNWVAEYFVAVFSYSPTASALQVSLFWAGLLAGRFGVPLFYRGSRHDLVLVGFATLATAAVILITILGYAPPNAITNSVGTALVFLAGLGCSICYPEVMTLLGKCFPRAQSQVIGFAATGGGLGAFIFPFVMSAISQNWGIRAGFATYAVFAVVMTAFAIGLALSVSKNKRA